MARSTRNYDSQIASWFDQNLDLENRTIYMGSTSSHDAGESGVDNFMAEYFIKGIHLLEKRNSTAEINVVMNNPGGDWYHGMAIYDAIKNSSCHCIVKVYGYAMSMGSVILQAADKRIMMPNSRFMIHYGYDGLYGHTKIFQKWSDESKRVDFEMENIYLDCMMEKDENDIHSGQLSKSLSAIVNKQRANEIPPAIPVAYKLPKNLKLKRDELRVILRELLNFDTILNAEETVSLGLADEVFSRV